MVLKEEYNSEEKLNDFLIQYKINDDIRNNLMKEYINLLDKEKVLKTHELENKLDGIINSNLIKEFCEIYENEINENKLIPEINRDSPDSIIFLSEINDKSLSKFRRQKFLQTKILDFDKCKQYLKETENLLIVRNNEIKSFFYDEDEKKIINEIYFDDENHKNLPKCDVLYRKVNNYYYVKNENYFEKCVYYYYELYSNIFAIFDLKKIKLQYHNINNNKNQKSINLNVGAADINLNNENIDNNEQNDIKVMEFTKKNYKNDRYNEFNSKKKVNDQIKYLLNELPINFRKSMYNPNNIINIINNRTKNVLTKFEQMQIIENTNIEKVEISIKSKFNLTSEFGIFGNYEKNSYKKESVVFIMEFYDLEDNLNINNQYSPSQNLYYENDNYIERNFFPELSYKVCAKESNKINQELYINNDEIIKINKAETPQLDVKDINQEKIVHENIHIKNPKKLEWVLLKRGDNLPSNAIYGGTTKKDGEVYVGKINNSPGKVNLENNKIWNYWVQNIGSSQTGFVLISDYQYEWLPIKRGDEIPMNAIYCGLDEHNDKVWIGKSYDDEPGKVTCISNSDNKPKMKNIWCHSLWSGNPTCYILIIKTSKNTFEKKIEEFDSF